MKRAYLAFFVSSILVLTVSVSGFGQESVFTGLRSDMARAKWYFSQGMYENALGLYLSAEKKEKGGDSISLEIATTYFELKEYENAENWYQKYRSDTNHKMTAGDLLKYADALTSTKKYEKAIEVYKEVLEITPNDEKVAEKVWRLSNIQYLKEDSVYYSVKMALISMDGTQYSPTLYQDGLVFVGYKDQFGGLKRQAESSENLFKTLYFAKYDFDTVQSEVHLVYSEPETFAKNLDNKYNLGPVSFTAQQNKMVFARNGDYSKGQGSKLQLFFAENRSNKWAETEAFPFNSQSYSISDPAFSADGTVLYFASDMPGGYGGTDLYVSYLSNNTWSKPKNLGKKINTSGNESFPMIHENVLYFSSNGHAGLGGLDIYKINLVETSSAEVQNLGYPINSSADDFGMTLNPSGTAGFMSSNRNNQGLKDAIYEIEIDMQTYPLVISGKVKYKRLGWRDTDKFELLRNAELRLIDIVKNAQITKSQTDSSGNFQLQIPYASQYIIEIKEERLGELTVSLEIPKNKDGNVQYDIVVIGNKQENDDVVNDASQQSNKPGQ